jgi:hypothetical protein
MTMPLPQSWRVGQALPLVELVLMLAFAAVGLARSRMPRGSSGFGSIERWFDRLAKRRRLSVFAVGLAVVLIRAALIPVLGIPEPAVHDEFSYLLAADTFAHGRLTNPPHPMWLHFESFHIIQHPTYMSIYPPAEGLALALGERLGHPWLGQLLITAAMCSGLCWMLQGWLPSGWALLGGVLAVLRLGILSYWINGYWSASVVALGGALVLGALPRLKRHAHWREAAWMTLGLVILANSRPYEGFVLGVTVACAMLIWLFGKRRPPLAIALRRVVAPIAIILGLAAVADGYYNFRVTGSSLLMPYVVDHAAYGYAPFFLVQKPRPEPTYHHAVMREFYEDDFRAYQAKITLAGYLRFKEESFWVSWAFYLGPALTIPFLALPWIIRDRRMRFPLLAGAFFLVGLSIETWFLPHYLAPAISLLYLILLQGMRHLRVWRWRGRRAGPALVRAIPLVCCAMVVLRITAIVANAQIEPAWPRGNTSRARILRTLESSPGQHLVLVRYGTAHSPHNEWVYNAADIDAARVVWARDMGAQNNRELLLYFNGRHAWLIEPDASPPTLSPYPLDH